MPSFKIEIKINATPKTTWAWFFDDLAQWWSRDFYTDEKTKAFVWDQHIGGKLYEDFGDGEGLIWADVIGVDRYKSCLIRGMLSKDYGGPCMSFEKLSFFEKEEGTLVRFEVDFLGDIKESTLKSLEKGWKEIFMQHFQKYCEQKLRQ